jgi:hypothetical protein
MMQSIIVLMLIISVVRLSRLKDFLSSTSFFFPLDPSICTPQARALEMWRWVVKGGWSTP